MWAGLLYAPEFVYSGTGNVASMRDPIGAFGFELSGAGSGQALGSSFHGHGSIPPDGGAAFGHAVDGAVAEHFDRGVA